MSHFQGVKVILTFPHTTLLPFTLKPFSLIFYFISNFLAQHNFLLLASIILISQLTLIYKLTHNFLVPPSILTTIRLVLRFNNYCFTFSSIHTQLASSTHLHKSNTDMTSFCAIKTSSAYISHNNEHNSLSLTKFRPL